MVWILMWSLFHVNHPFVFNKERFKYSQTHLMCYLELYYLVIHTMQYNYTVLK